MSQQMLSVIVEGDHQLSLSDMINVLGLNETWFKHLVDIGILDVEGGEINSWRFDGSQLTRAQRAMRIQQDFNASFTALGLIMDLVDELDQLRQLKQYARRQLLADVDQQS